MSLNYGIKQIAPKMGNYHPDYVGKMIRGLVKSGEFELRHRFGPRSRIIMDDDEIEAAKQRIRAANIRK